MDTDGVPHEAARLVVLGDLTVRNIVVALAVLLSGTSSSISLNWTVAPPPATATSAKVLG